MSEPIRVFSPNGPHAGPLQSGRVTNKQVRIAVRCRCCVETCHWVRDNIADGIVALHDFNDAEFPARKRHGKHNPIRHIQLLADGHHLARSLIAKWARHRSAYRDEEEQGGQPTV